MFLNQFLRLPKPQQRFFTESKIKVNYLKATGDLKASLEIGLILKGYATPYIYPMIFFSICFLGWIEAFSPKLVDSNMPLDPSSNDRISLSSHKYRLVFYCCFDSSTREITLLIKKGRKRIKQRSILNPKSDFSCTRIETTTKHRAVFVWNFDLSDLWMRGLGAYLNRQVEVRRLQIIQESR